MIDLIYYNEFIRCYRNGKVERLFKKKGWKVVKNTDNNGGYNIIGIDNKIILRHRLIAYCFLGLQNIVGLKQHDDDIDHIDGNPLNNSVDNLRIVSHQENHLNRTTAKGYCFHKSHNKFQAQIRLNGKQIYLGRFDKEEDARQSYLNAKLIYHTIPVHN
jgi:hypothetical protein